MNRQILRTLNRLSYRILKPLVAVCARRSPRYPTLGASRRILLVKLVGMGDGVLIRQLATLLARVRPGIEITVLSGPSTSDVLTFGAGFEEIFYDPVGVQGGLAGFLRTVRAIRAGKFDAVIDYEQHIVLVSVLLWLAGVPIRIGASEKSNPRQLFQTHTVEYGGEDSMWNVYSRLTNLAAPIPVSALPEPLVPPVEGQDTVEKLLREAGLSADARILGIHLGSGGRSAARRWPVARFVQLAETLRGPVGYDAVLLTGTAAEEDLIKEFREGFTGRVLDGTKLGSLAETAASIVRCSLFVSNDTGVMHLAAATGVPTLGLFGPNLPSRYAPVGPRVASLYRTTVPCSPCINIHLGQVPGCSHPAIGRCLLDITVEEAARAALELLERSASPCATRP